MTLHLRRERAEVGLGGRGLLEDLLGLLFGLELLQATVDSADIIFRLDDPSYDLLDLWPDSRDHSVSIGPSRSHLVQLDFQLTNLLANLARPLLRGNHLILLALLLIHELEHDGFFLSFLLLELDGGHLGHVVHDPFDRQFRLHGVVKFSDLKALRTLHPHLKAGTVVPGLSLDHDRMVLITAHSDALRVWSSFDIPPHGRRETILPRNALVQEPLQQLLHTARGEIRMISRSNHLHHVIPHLPISFFVLIAGPMPATKRLLKIPRKHNPVNTIAKQNKKRYNKQKTYDPNHPSNFNAKFQRI